MEKHVLIFYFFKKNISLYVQYLPNDSMCILYGIELRTYYLPAAIGLNCEVAWAGSRWIVTETFHGIPSDDA
jgi:hypothetical protein